MDVTAIRNRRICKLVSADDVELILGSMASDADARRFCRHLNRHGYELDLDDRGLVVRMKGQLVEDEDLFEEVQSCFNK